MFLSITEVDPDLGHPIIVLLPPRRSGKLVGCPHSSSPPPDPSTRKHYAIHIRLQRRSRSRTSTHFSSPAVTVASKSMGVQVRRPQDAARRVAKVRRILVWQGKGLGGSPPPGRQTYPVAIAGKSCGFVGWSCSWTPTLIPPFHPSRTRHPPFDGCPRSAASASAHVLPTTPFRPKLNTPHHHP